MDRLKLGSMVSKNLLAVAVSSRRTGWAVFVEGRLKDTGVISLPFASRVKPEEREVMVAIGLDEQVEGWKIETVAFRRRLASPIPARGVPSPEAALSRWGEMRGLAVCSYTTGEIRRALAGRSNASREALAFGTMARLELIGVKKSMDEWEAAAIGAYHLRQIQN